MSFRAAVLVVVACCLWPSCAQTPVPSAVGPSAGNCSTLATAPLCNADASCTWDTQSNDCRDTGDSSTPEPTAVPPTPMPTTSAPTPAPTPVPTPPPGTAAPVLPATKQVAGSFQVGLNNTSPIPANILSNLKTALTTAIGDTTTYTPSFVLLTAEPSVLDVGFSLAVPVNEYSTVTATVAGWATTPPTTLIAAVRSSVTSVLSVDSEDAAFSEYCTFQGTALEQVPVVPQTPPSIISCDTTLDLSVTTVSVVEDQRLATVLCTAAALPTCTGVTASASGAIDATNGGYLSTVSFTNLTSPTEVFVTLASKALIAHRDYAEVEIMKMSIANIMMFTSSASNNNAPCTEKSMWWLVFLILLLPAILMSVRHAYRRGKKRGKNQILHPESGLPPQYANNPHLVPQQQHQQQQQQFGNSHMGYTNNQGTSRPQSQQGTIPPYDPNRGAQGTQRHYAGEQQQYQQGGGQQYQQGAYTPQNNDQYGDGYGNQQQYSAQQSHAIKQTP